MSEWIAPAPWSQDKYGSIVDGNGESVRFRGVSTLCAGTEQAIAQAKANTTLATAAPELLAALESAQMAIMGYTHQNAVTLAALFKANAAIAKARGTPC